MSIEFHGSQFSLDSLKRDLQNPSPTFSVLKGRRFKIQDQQGNSHLLRLNEIIQMLGKGVENHSQSHDLKEILFIVGKLENKGYESQSLSLAHLVSSLKHQFSHHLFNRAQIIDEMIQKLGLSHAPLKQAEPVPLPKNSPKDNLIQFYLNQNARLKEKKEPENTIRKIENSSYSYHVAYWQAAHKTDKSPTCEEIALYTGRSLVQTRASLTGEAYLERLPAYVDQMRAICLKIPEEKVPAPLDKTLALVKTGSFTATPSNLEKLFALFTIASNDPSTLEEASRLNEKIDQDVAQLLGITTEELLLWTNQVEQEREAQELLTQLPSKPTPEHLSQFILLSEKLPADSFTKPLTLFKLQEILNQLSSEDPNYPKIQGLMETVIDAMSLKRQHSFLQLYQLQTGETGHLDVATKRVMQQMIPGKTDGAKPLKPTISALVQDLNSLDKQLASSIKKLSKSSPLEKESLTELFSFLPPSLAEPLSAKINDEVQISTQAFKVELTKQILNIALKIPESSTLDQRTLADAIKNQVEKLSIIFEEGKFKFKVPGNYSDVDLADARGMASSLGSLFNVPCNGTNFSDFTKRTADQLSGDFTQLAEKLSNEALDEFIRTNPNFGQKILSPHLKIIQQKVSKVTERETKRLELLQDNQPVFLPRFFHATSTAAAAVSIAHTGIESVQPEQTDWFGAFFSTHPEFRYGSVIFGLPDKVKTASEAEVFFDHDTHPNGFVGAGEFWAGLKEAIAINPRQLRLEADLHAKIQRSVEASLPKTPDGKRDYVTEAKIVTTLKKSLGYRYGVIPGSEERGWVLHYRPLGKQGVHIANNVIPIESDEKLLNAITKAAKGTTLDPVICKEQFDSLYSNQFDYDQYHVLGALEEPLNAVMISSDTDPLFEDFYRAQFDKLHKKKRVAFETITEVKKSMKEAGISEKQVEIIPLSEQLLEIDLLKNQGRMLPKDWHYKERNSPSGR